MQYLPLCLDTNGCRILIIGAGEVASRKLELLTRTQAYIHIIGLAISSAVAQFTERDNIKISERAVTEEDINDIDLLYIATSDKKLNAQLYELANSKNILCNVVDDPDLCDFITPSIIDRGRLQVAITTSGAAPVLARELRANIETILAYSLSPLLDFVASKRAEVQQRLTTVKLRRIFWERFFKLNGHRFDSHSHEHYQQAFELESLSGELLLVSEGTIPTLLPIAALSLLQKIDIIYSEQTIPFELNELIRRDAQRDKIAEFSVISNELLDGKHCLIYCDDQLINQLKAYFPSAKHIKPGAL